LLEDFIAKTSNQVADGAANAEKPGPRDMAVRRGRRVVVTALACALALLILPAVKVGVGGGSAPPRSLPQQTAQVSDDAAAPGAVPSSLPAAPAPPGTARLPAPASLGREQPKPQSDSRPRGDIGIGSVPRPGTKPVKPGIIVPDDFPLPPGYLRHYQATADGEHLPPILMFHPDYQPVDASGRPVTMPDDFIVPPELAPPGMPLRMLEVTPVHRDSTP
jgi:hypothetical protein